VRNLYLNLITGKLRVKRAAFNLEYANGQLKQGEERLEQKVISDGQMFSIRIAAERAQVEAERTAFLHQGNLAAFARLTGQTLRPEDVPDAVPSIESQASVLQGLVQGFLAQSEFPTNEALYMRRSLELERLNLANQKTRLKPKLTLVLSATQDEQRYETIGYKYEVQSYYAGVSIGWTIFDGFSSRSAVRSSMAKIRAMENDYRVLTDRLGEQAQNQLRLAEFSFRTSAINDKLLVSAEGNLATKREQFDRGAISKEEVDIAQLALYDAQLTAYAYRMDYLVQISELLGIVVEDPILANLPAGK
jgi:outer membrane protein TolC